MRVEAAKKLKYGQLVRCPEDMGQPAFNGTVRDEGLARSMVHKNHFGDEFIWVTVMGPGKVKSVWPSNRLGAPL